MASPQIYGMTAAREQELGLLPRVPPHVLRFEESLYADKSKSAAGVTTPTRYGRRAERKQEPSRDVEVWRKEPGACPFGLQLEDPACRQALPETSDTRIERVALGGRICCYEWEKDRGKTSLDERIRVFEQHARYAVRRSDIYRLRRILASRKYVLEHVERSRDAYVSFVEAVAILYESALYRRDSLQTLRLAPQHDSMYPVMKDVLEPQHLLILHDQQVDATLIRSCYDLSRKWELWAVVDQIYESYSPKRFSDSVAFDAVSFRREREANLVLLSGAQSRKHGPRHRYWLSQALEKVPVFAGEERRTEIALVLLIRHILRRWSEADVMTAQEATYLLMLLDADAAEKLKGTASETQERVALRILCPGPFVRGVWQAERMLTRCRTARSATLEHMTDFHLEDITQLENFLVFVSVRRLLLKESIWGRDSVEALYRVMRFRSFSRATGDVEHLSAALKVAARELDAEEILKVLREIDERGLLHLSP